MKNKLGLIGLLLVIGLSLNFYSCEKKGSNDDEPDEVGDANLTGQIINSQTGEGLANATLYFTRNLSATDYNNADYIVTTDGNGNFTLTNAISGNYICFVVSNGYFQRIITGILISSGNNTLDAITLVDAPETGSLRIVLTWGEIPSDLDSHLTGPEGNGERFHMHYSNQNPNEYISLDVDDTDSYGPETTTISAFFDGMYRFSVHNYTDRYTADGGSGIKTSPAKVELYDSNGLIQTFNPPTFTGNGDIWRVFEINVNGSNYTVNAVNTYVLTTTHTDITKFKSSNQKVNQFNISDF